MTKFWASIVMAGVIATNMGSAEAGGVKQQLDEFIAAAKGKRIGMITNPSGCDESGAPDVDYLIAADDTTITAFFAPEHGLRGDQPAGAGGTDYIDPVTSVPVWSIYGPRRAPTDEQLQTVDLLVFDMQDVGVRFYTFQWSMTYCMEAAAKNNKPFYVIDRPNPIGGVRVEGAVNTQDYGLIGRLATGAAIGVATRHGMTVGELAKMWNEEYMSTKVELHVIKIPDWKREQLWPETGRVFVRPSPNMRTFECTQVYPGTCIFEGSNVSEGRGTDAPFEKIGAPFIDPQQYADELTSLSLPGVQFEPITFTPTSSNFANQECGGVKVVVSDSEAFDPIRTGIHMLQTVWKMYPTQATMTNSASRLMGIPNLHERLKTEKVEDILAETQALREQFMQVRAKYLLYGASSSKATGWNNYAEGEEERQVVAK